jgi:hypothetical protein
MEKVTKIIGVMDPNGYSFRVSFEKLIAFLQPEIEHEGKIHRVITQRISTRPYDVLNAECPYSAIINRGAHWNPHHNSYFMTIGHETYLLNDMSAFQAINKNTTYGHMYKLGFHIPPTVALPQQDYDDIKSDPRAIPDLIFSEHEPFDLKEIGEEIGYPAYLKPQSGGGWVGVTRVHNYEELLAAYNRSGIKPMNLQKAIEYKEFVRTVGVGPQMLPMHYNPNAPYSHDRYLRSKDQAVAFEFLTPAEEEEAKKICKVINAFYGWDHNSCEALLTKDGIFYLIDFANAYPDSSLVSLHFYFPTVVKAMAKWMIFCAVKEKKKSFHFAHDWDKYFSVMREQGISYKEKLDRYSALADEHFETQKFEEFCQEALPNFDKQALEFFSQKEFEYIIEQEIRYYFKATSETPDKIKHYKGIHEFWTNCEKKRLYG